jgi:hypothetical protein
MPRNDLPLLGVGALSVYPQASIQNYLSILAIYGEWYGGLPLTENGQGLVHENSDEPTAERSFVLESWRIPRRRNPAALNRLLSFFITTEYAECEEMEKRTASRKPLLK